MGFTLTLFDNIRFTFPTDLRHYRAGDTVPGCGWVLRSGCGEVISYKCWPLDGEMAAEALAWAVSAAERAGVPVHWHQSGADTPTVIG